MKKYRLMRKYGCEYYIQKRIWFFGWRWSTVKYMYETQAAAEELFERFVKTGTIDKIIKEG